jgi:hypothetical protein
MKKSSKPSKTPAPAKKSKPAARKAPAAPAPAVKKTAPKPVVTSISARIDVGFGNQLFIRGEGPGLSWDKGAAMECTGDDQWTFVLGESSRPFAFKFLINDQDWSVGEDYSATPGATLLLTPTF